MQISGVIVSSDYALKSALLGSRGRVHMGLSPSANHYIDYQFGKVKLKTYLGIVSDYRASVVIEPVAEHCHLLSIGTLKSRTLLYLGVISDLLEIRVATLLRLLGNRDNGVFFFRLVVGCRQLLRHRTN